MDVYSLTLWPGRPIRFRFTFDFLCWGVVLLLRFVAGGAALIIGLGPVTLKIIIGW